MKTSILILLLLAPTTLVLGQIIAPGGVANPEIWFQQEEFQNSNQLINFHAFESFDHHSSGNYPNASTNQTSIFTVYAPQGSELEQVVWRIEEDQSDAQILTTRRIADLNQVRYMNFVDLPKQKAFLNTYIQHLSKEYSKTEKGIFHIGSRALDQDLPVEQFAGLIPEVIKYDRILNHEEKLKVESYLAIKYGLTIQNSGLSFYLNSLGDVIWDGGENAKYCNRITGIGRDDQSGLNQKQSTSIINPGQITINVNQIQPTNAKNDAELADQSFLIWGDDGNEMTFSTSGESNTSQIARKWKVQASGQTSELSTQVSFRRNDILHHLSESEIFWLLIDRSGKGDFEMNDMEAIPMSNTHASNSITFDGVSWDRDQSGEDVFTIAAAPELLVTYSLTLPECGKAESASIQGKVFGGKGPYIITLLDEFGQTMRAVRVLNDAFAMTELPVGGFTMHTKSTDGLVTVNEISIDNVNGPIINLPTNVQLFNSKHLLIDAHDITHQLGTSYSWKKPNGSTILNSKIEIDEPGKYQLTSEFEGCVSYHVLNAEIANQQSFQHASLFPNPTTDGKFFIDVSLTEVSNIQMEVFHSNGQKIHSREIPDVFHQRIMGDLQLTAGQYFVKLTTGKQTQTLKLIKQ